ncbi:cuticle protein 63-like [Tribolium madens]|uniref:cuticle protein 63-like n=1 Tax=Tribolium madens TaxID=41895 RepID=UPI001CF726D0|nr:cuticle protein 63-like [Tribolium madens]
MFKIVVFFVSIASALAKPGLLHGVAAPTAFSQQTRHDIIHPGVITYTTAHAAPVVAAAPVAVAAPAVQVSSAATSHLDVRRPLVAAAPVAVGVVGHAGGLGLGGVGLGLGVGFGGQGHGVHGYGK